MKKILFSFLILFSLFSVFGALTDNNVLYYSFDSANTTGTTMLDISGNGYDGVCTGMTNCNTILGLLNNATNFDGSNDVINTNYLITPTEFSFSFWIKGGATGIIFDNYNGNTNNFLRIEKSSSSAIRMDSGAGSRLTTSSYTLTSPSDWNHIIYIRDDTNNQIRLYVNGVSVQNTTDSRVGSFNTGLSGYISRVRDIASGYFTGDIDEYSIYNKTLNTTEISDLYNSGNGFNPYNIDNNFITLNNLTANNETFINNSFYNTQNITFSLNLSINEGASNPNTTMTVWKNNTIYYQETVNNNLTPSFNIDNFSDSGSRYNFSFYSINNVTNATFGNYTLIVDLTPPSINNSLPLEYNFYNINLSNYISCYDIETGYCNITFNLDGVSVSTNTTDYNFTINGNQTYEIIAFDSAGNNVTENGNIFINPFVYLYFNNSITNNAISDYSIDGFTVNGTEYKRKYFDIFTTTNQTFNFIKEGYVTTDFNITMLNNQTINETILITPVNLFIRAFNSETLNQINFDLILKNGNITSYTGLTTFNQSYPNIPLGDLEATVTSSGYSQAVYYFTLQDNSSLSFDIYLVPSNVSDVVTFTLRDFNSNSLLEGVLIEAKQIINDSEVSTQQVLTSSNGLAYLNLDISKDYSFVFSKDGYVSTTIESIPGVTTYTVKIKSDATQYTYIDSINYKFTPEITTIKTGTNTTFKLFVYGSGLTESEAILTDNFGNILYSATSTNPTGNTFQTTQEFLNTTNITSVTMTLNYIVNGISKNVSKQYDIFTLGDSGIKNFSNFSEDKSENSRLIRFFIVITTFATFIILGTRINANNVGISFIVAVPLVFFTVVGWIPFLYATVLSIILFFIYMGGNKR